MTKKILGLDLGTNSIGWANITINENNKTGNIIDLGSRIIPMSQDILSEFDKGNSISQTAARTGYRGVRRLHERNLLRRERLHRVLNVLNFLPVHFANKIDEYGNFLNKEEAKIAYFLNEEGKYQFLFKTAYNEMINDFKKSQPQLFYNKRNGTETKIPYDWTIYYLRKKALTEKIDKEELAWLLLHFNQKRGYYQLRGEDEVKNENKTENFYNLKIIDVQQADKGKKDGEIWYNVILENGWVYKRSSRIPLFDWKGKYRDFIVTTELNEDGTVKKDKENKEKRSFRAPKEDDWGLLKKKTEKDIVNSQKFVGAFIYDTLLQHPNQKIKGKLVRTIERDFYKAELTQIIETQIKHHKELQSDIIYKKCIDALYPNNEDYKNSILKNDFKYLFIKDLIFYQRPLKSKKSQISDCAFEMKPLKDKEGILLKNQDGSQKTTYLKCIAKSHPLFQEFRIWQWISNVKIFERNLTDDIDVTNEYLNTENDYEKLFNFLNERKEIDQNTFIKYLLEPLQLKGKALTEKVSRYRWNYIDDSEKTYPCNETHFNINTRLSKTKNIPDNFLTQLKEIELWHILYSVTDKNEIIKALNTFASKNKIDIESFVENFKRYPLIKSEYGSYSEKSIKKLLPLMRLGKYWDENIIISQMPFYQKNKEIVIANINKRENSNSKIKEELEKLDANINAFKNLRKEIATYLVYAVHSEAINTDKWETPADIESYLKHFKQHSLRNPIVEQIITETLRVVKDIWINYGNSEPNYFDEIHIELGREMKNNAADRKAITDNNIQNENTNTRIRALLSEFKNIGIESVIPHSPYQQEALKIYEDGVLKSGIEIPEDIIKISKSANISNSDILKYKLWLDQKYQSPYTGKIIPLSKLFTTAYQIEHIIPQSIYFDDSFSNKVICESEVNKAKDNMFGLEFIKETNIRKIQLNGGGFVELFTEEQYKEFIAKIYANNKAKAKKLMLEEVPEKMIERQLNDTRYISKEVKNLLSKIVRSSNNDDGVTSKNVLSTNGTITSTLKQDWGFNDVWNDLMLPRFERLNELTKTTHFTYYNTTHQKKMPTVPDELRKGFQIKRIDHRHHAMDALVIACTSRNHINYLNNQTALDKLKKKNEKQQSREDLKQILCFKNKTDNNGNYKWQFYKPWETITQDVKAKLETIVVSIKQNLRVINKSVNYYQKFIDGKKLFVKQTKGDSWAIRKPLHKETVYGKVNIKTDFGKAIAFNNVFDKIDLIIDKELKQLIKNKLKENNNDFVLTKKFFKENPILKNGNQIDKVNVYEWVEGTASRVALNDSFTETKIKESITDTAIQKILLNHLKNYVNKLDEKGKEIPPHLLAFSPEGIEEMNKNIITLNNGIKHQPIYKVRVYEAGNRFAVGYSGNKKEKYVEAAKGTNLFFAIYQDANGKRNYETIALNIVIERLKQGLPPVPDKENNKLLFHLSPNDFVYIPTDDEKENLNAIDFKKLNKEQINRIYKMVSSTGSQSFFIKSEIANSIYNKVEFTTLNKMEKSINGIMIKENCIKINIDRLGNIKI